MMKNRAMKRRLVPILWSVLSLTTAACWGADPAVDLTPPDTKLVPLDFKMHDIEFTVMAPEGAVVTDGLDTYISKGDDFGFMIEFGRRPFRSDKKWWADGGGFLSTQKMLVNSDDLFLVKSKEKSDKRFCIGVATSVPDIDLFITARKKGSITVDVQTRENCLLILKCAKTLALKKDPPRDLPALLDWLKIEVRKKNIQGDVTAVTLPYAWTEAAIPVLLKMPQLTSIWSESRDTTAEGLKRLSALKNLQELSFPAVTPISNDMLAAEAGFPELVQLNSSSFFDVAQVDQAGLSQLQKLKKLERLNLDNYNFSDAGVASLSNITTLKSLDIGCDEQVKERGLKYRYKCSDVTDAGITSLAKLRDLQALYLSRLEINGSGFKALTGLQNLQTLWLRDTLLDDQGLQHICKLHGLQKLDLSRTDVTDAGLTSLSSLNQLTWLNLSGTQITSAGLKSLGELNELKDLDLTATALTGEGFEVLARLPKLEHLDLDQSPIDDAGVAHLAGCKSLKYLSLDKTKITDAGLMSLAGLKNLTVVSTEHTAVTREGTGKYEDARDAKP